MRVIIAGSRCFNDYDLLKKKCDRILKNQNNITILSGMAKGADTLACKYAEENGYELEKHFAEWGIYGKKSAILRNKKMGDLADSLIAFHDGRSRGTAHMIDYAKKKELNVRVINF